jgi:hypothetical protein
VPVPQTKRDIDAGRIQEFLVSRGVNVEWVSSAEDQVGAYYLIESDTDPAPVLAQYIRPVTREDRAREALKAIVPKLIDNTATIAELRQGLLAVTVLMRDQS